MKKIVALMITLFCFVNLFACVGESGGGKQTTNSGSSSDTSGNYVHELPVIDYDSRSYRVSLLPSFAGYEFYVAEDSADPLESAMYIRNTTVQDTYDVVIEPVYYAGSATGANLHGHAEEAATLILTDIDTFDIVTPYVCSAGPLILESLLIDWNSLKYTYLDGSWWVNSINENFELDGHIYNPVGSTNTTALLYTFAVIMNKNLADDLHIYDEVIEKVRNNEWTIDYFNTLVSGFFSEIDGTPGHTAGDFYGFQAENLTNLDMYPFAFDIPYLEKDDDDTLIYSFGQGEYREKLVNAANLIHELYWENDGAYIHTSAGYEQDAFMSDRAVFSTINFRRLISYVKNMESTYTVIPYPMYDENQDKYRTGMGDNYTMCCMPITVKDRDFVSLITEALNMEAEKTLYPAYYENAIKTKYQDDMVSYEMIELIMDGRTADLGVVFMKDLEGLPAIFRASIMHKNNDIVTRLDSTTDQIKFKLEEIVDSYLASASN